VLIAGTDGNAKFNGMNVEISEGFVVNGNVDFSTGNIKYAKSVVVSGDVEIRLPRRMRRRPPGVRHIEDAEINVNAASCASWGSWSGQGHHQCKGDVTSRS